MRTALPTWTPEDKALATRQSSQLVLNKIAEAIPDMMGGSADLTPSNLTKFRGALDFQMATPEGRYVRFGVREHAMAAMCRFQSVRAMSCPGSMPQYSTCFEAASRPAASRPRYQAR